MHPLRYARAGSIYEDGSNRVYALVNKNEGICETRGCSPKYGTEWKSRLRDLPANRLPPASLSCQAPSRSETFSGVMRDAYSDKKLFLGMALRPQNSPSPSSATNAMM